MSEVRLVVREAEADWSGTVHASDAERAVAALSADPATLEEFEVAVARFSRPTAGRRFFGNLLPGLNAEPHDAGLVVIDLAARLVAADSACSDLAESGAVSYHDGQVATDQHLRYHLADDWLFVDAEQAWEALARERRAERAAAPALDARAVFYGRPMIEFVVRETFAAFARRDEIAAAFQPKGEPWPGRERYGSPFYETLSQIHADWLLTPRGDLSGRCPREVALERHGHLTWDLEDRCLQWSTLNRCPPALPEASHAYRFGGFGTHELVMYYELVRELLWSCWERLEELARHREDEQRSGEGALENFLADEVPRLEAFRDEWLDAPHPEHHDRTPRSIIDRERARLPEGSTGPDGAHDPDCPCCQMLADMPGPWFWHLDGCNMDDHFAFNMFCVTREEWDEERRHWEEFHRRFDAESAERERLGVVRGETSAGDAESVWSRSYVAGDVADAPLGVRLFAIGCRLSELLVDLRGEGGVESGGEVTPPEARQHIDQLNRDFGNLRELLQNSERSVAEALLEPAIDRFAETLAAVAADRPALAEKCESLTQRLRTFADPPEEPQEDEESEEYGLGDGFEDDLEDDGLPF